MRKAMICVSVMLALFQVWPVVFGHRGGTAPTAKAVVAAVPRAVMAVATASSAPKIAPAMASEPAPKTCYRQYLVKFAECAAGDQACHVKAADQWDLCDATGMWPK